MKKIHIFISSPSDVAEEREAIERQISLLNGMSHIKEKFVLEALRYENAVPAAVGDAPQPTVDKYMLQASRADIYIGVLWRRMGTPLVHKDQEYQSGTHYEFVTAYKSRRQWGKPLILLYRGDRLPLPGEPPRTPDEEAQALKVNEFFQDFEGAEAKFKGIYRRYQSINQLEDMILQDVTKMVDELQSARPSWQVLAVPIGLTLITLLLAADLFSRFLQAGLGALTLLAAAVAVVPLAFVGFDYIIAPMRQTWPRKLLLQVLVIVGLFLARQPLLDAAIREEEQKLATSSTYQQVEIAYASIAALGGNSQVIAQSAFEQALENGDEQMIFLAKILSTDENDARLLYTQASEGFDQAITSLNQNRANLVLQAMAELDSEATTAHMGELTEQGLMYLQNVDGGTGFATIIFEAIRSVDESGLLMRPQEVQAVTLYNLGYLYEQSNPDKAIEMYRLALNYNNADLETRYILSSLLLIRGDYTEASRIAAEGDRYLSREICRGQVPADLFWQAWTCFRLTTVQASARFELYQHDPSSESPGDIQALAQRAVDLAHANDDFGADFHTAEAYYVLAKLTEPNTDPSILKAIIQERNPSIDRHDIWRVYANQQCRSRNLDCTSDS